MDGSDSREDNLLGPDMPGWEKTTWILIIVYIIIVLLVFWFLGWKAPDPWSAVSPPGRTSRYLP